MTCDAPAYCPQRKAYVHALTLGGMALGLVSAGTAVWGAGPSHEPAPVVTSGAQGPEILYDMRHGDTLWHFAQVWLEGPHAAEELGAANHIANPRHLAIGTRLHIPVRLLRTEPSDATVQTFSGTVLLRAGTQAFGPRPGLALSEGTRVETGANAFITLKLRDGTAISVPSQSDLKLARLRKVLLTGSILRDIEVFAGRMHATVTPMPDPSSTFRVKTPLAVSAVRGTDFRVEYTPGATLSATTVTGGKVAVATPAVQADTLVPAGFGAASDAHGTSAPVPLLPAPMLAPADHNQSGAQLQFTLSPVPGASAYRIQLARDPAGRDIIAETSSPSPQIALPDVPSGDYFLIASAVDGRGLEGLSASSALHRCHNTISTHVAPAISSMQLRLRFSWNAQADSTPTYHFRLMRRGQDAPYVDRPGLAANTLDLDRLPPSDYSWTVTSSLGEDAKACEATSAPETFHIAQK